MSFRRLAGAPQAWLLRVAGVEGLWVRGRRRSRCRALSFFWSWRGALLRPRLVVRAFGWCCAECEGAGVAGAELCLSVVVCVWVCLGVLALSLIHI